MNAFSDILGYLLQTAISLYLLAMLLRLVLQLVRADFYNPISQFLVKITNPLVLPLRRVLPNVARLDLASLSLALLLQILAIASILLLNGLPLPNPFVLIVWGFIGLLSLLVNIYFFALLAVIILSWIAPNSNSPALLLLHQITEPVMAPFRKMLPPMGGMDFSPIIVFILINVIQIALRHMAVGAGLHPALVIGL
ncbi:YggT family protein [Parahaliea sp. F7430]|uniref:YggT family protein n=1 Tax=Sediminihaliea albiluteola TaxID=2758564 RepID=A0A7W2TX35_9GAMM|nr:YggT family protein [Sediminihaliea albiluteola]MBA6413562.1 YggT family protein [Sediminihaliea albiluteola]